jgi:type IV pilus assembly protein PilE
MSRTSQQGVTLIELMVAAAIVAILAALAYPSYQLQVRQSRRAAAQAFLMDVAARQQQHMVDVRSYASVLNELGMTVPPEVNGFYTIGVAAVAGPPLAFTLTATPAGAQTQDRCGALTLNQAGRKSPDTCW